MALAAVHPGEHLAEELEALNMSAAELARKIDVPTNRANATCTSSCKPSMHRSSASRRQPAKWPSSMATSR
jgi:hypothetical protein